MWSNYHAHNQYCDGKGSIHDYITAAFNQKVFSIGISSHAPLPFPATWCMKPDRLKAYHEEIDLLKDTTKNLQVYKGLEVDFIPGEISPFQYYGQLDYVIGGIHFVDKLPDGRRWEIDGPHALFQEGLTQIFNNNFKDAVVRYFELSREMLYSSTPDIIAHMDKIKIQNLDGKFFNENDSWYQDEVKKLINVIDHGNIIVEVNTRGIYQKKSQTTYPSPWILEILNQKNIRITISSDAHHPDDLTSNFSETAQLLAKIGFKTLSVLEDGGWKQYPFDQNGIIR